MEFQKNKIIDELEKNGWRFDISYIPEENWPYLEVISFKKSNTSIYLTFFKDPTSGYVYKQLRGNKFKYSSGEFDALLYENDPNLTDDAIKISELNLGKGWETKLSEFIADSEKYYKKN